MCIIHVNFYLLFLQTCENMPKEEMKKIYVDIALKLFGNDLGWFSFHGRECQITYQHIIDAILNNFDNSVADKKNIEVNNYFNIYLFK